MIDGPIREKAHAYLAGVVNNTIGFARKIGGTADHVHILADIKPVFALADVLRDLKANSSRWIHETFPEKSKFAWQTGYGAFSVSVSSIPDVMAYIEKQEEHHKKMTFQEEYLKFLQKHNIQYDPKYVWE